MKFTKIPVNKIKKYGEQPRKNFDNDDLEQLAASIKEIGQLHPIIVQYKNDEYLLIAGERRLRAVKKTGEEEIVAMVIECELEDFKIQQMQLVENLHRKDLNYLERAVFIKNFMKQNNLTKKEASNKLGIPRTTLSEWLNILDVRPEYQQAVLNDDSAVTLSHITLANNLAHSTGDPTKIKKLLDAVIQYNLTREETRYILDLYSRHLHLPIQEAINTILIKREREKYNNSEIKNEKKKTKDKVNTLVRTFKRTGENLEKVMESIGELDEKNREKIIDEFVYIYQLLEILIPEIKDLNKNELLKKLKEKTVQKKV